MYRKRSKTPIKKLNKEVNKSRLSLEQNSLAVNAPSFFHSVVSPTMNMQKKIEFAIPYAHGVNNSCRKTTNEQKKEEKKVPSEKNGGCILL